jgi:hypothetical protein
MSALGHATIKRMTSVTAGLKWAAEIRQEGVLPASRSAPEDYDIEDGRITTIYVVRNPDKLRQH